MYSKTVNTPVNRSQEQEQLQEMARSLEEMLSPPQRLD